LIIIAAGENVRRTIMEELLRELLLIEVFERIIRFIIDLFS